MTEAASSPPRSDLAARLHRALARGADAARQRRVQVLVTVCSPMPPRDPLALFVRARQPLRSLWLQPSLQFSLVALGSTCRIVAHGPDRFAHLATGWRLLTTDSVVDQGAAMPLTAPVALVGSAFDPALATSPSWQRFPPAELVLPEVTLLSVHGASWLITTTVVHPGDDAPGLAERVRASASAVLAPTPGPAEPRNGRPVPELVSHGSDSWRDAVLAARERIRGGDLEKVVLARQAELVCAPCFDREAALRRLAVRFPSCTVFAWAREDGCFVGASPESLVRLSGGTVTTASVAGTASRGATPVADRALGERLRSSAKERHEHALVVESLRERLRPWCRVLHVPEQPELLKLPNVQHLRTPVRGRVRDGVGLLDLATDLHPTPATGGLPRAAALDLIRRAEPFDRGWYAGALGWLDRAGDGELAVAIRSALVRGDRALLWAGCGIVAASDTDAELEESRLKLEPMLRALGASPEHG